METPDRCWKWGIFYINRDDRALLVCKRYGIGYTLNFGNRWSWAILAVTLTAILLPFTMPICFIEALRHARGSLHSG